VKLKLKIQKELGLPISIGISKTKWIAKIATNAAKPFGVKLIKQEEVANFVKNMNVGDFPGIGKGYEDRLLKYHIKKLGEVKDHKELFYSWGKSGIQLYNRICGTDTQGISIAQEKKSIGLGRSFDPISNRIEIQRRINVLCRHVSFLCLKGHYKPLTFSLQIRYQYGFKSYETINANRLFNERYLKSSMLKLFDKIDIHKTHSIIQINLTLGNFDKNKYTTFDLLNYDSDNKEHNLGKSMQELRNKFGIDIIKSAGEM
jgi:DNA polymerase-4